MNYWHVLGFSAIVAPLTLAGCGGTDLDLGQVSGKVTMNGQPVSAATVSFIPDSAQNTRGPMSSGILNEQGEFTLSTIDGVEGAVIGYHKVTVTCPFDESAGSSAAGDAVAPVSTTPCDVPDKYEGYATTDLTAEVEKGTNEFTFDLQP
jgi:hypothetical protein